MPLIAVNARADCPVIAGSDTQLLHRLHRALTGANGPVIILIHGMNYTPGHARACPHRTLLSDTPFAHSPRIISWPRHLGFGRGLADEGLCIAFGWPARSSFRKAYRSAETAGLALARLVTLIGDIAPDRPVHVVAHSLGARVFLSALHHSKPGAFGRAILMAGAELHSEADRALETFAGQGTEIFNVTSRENDLFGALAEWAVAPFHPGARALGAGLAQGRANCIDIQLDCPDTRRALDALGFRIAPPARRICHWSSYMRAGLFPFYAVALRHPDRLALTTLQRRLPATPHARWSRLFAPPGLNALLPFLRKT